MDGPLQASSLTVTVLGRPKSVTETGMFSREGREKEVRMKNERKNEIKWWRNGGNNYRGNAE